MALSDRLRSGERKAAEQSQLVLLQQSHIQRLKAIAKKDKQLAEQAQSFEKPGSLALRLEGPKQLAEQPGVSPLSSKGPAGPEQHEFNTAEGVRLPSDKRQTLKHDFSAPAIYRLGQGEHLPARSPLDHVSKRIQAIQRPAAEAPATPLLNPHKPRGVFARPEPPQAPGMQQEAFKK